MVDPSRKDGDARDESSGRITDHIDLPEESLTRRNLLAGAGGMGGLLLGGAIVMRRSSGDTEPEETLEPAIGGDGGGEPQSGGDSGGDDDGGDGGSTDEEGEMDTDEEFAITDPALEQHIEDHGLPEPPELSDIDASRTVDAVDDLGLDSTGEEPIQGTLADAIQDGDRIEFPDGDYRLSSHLQVSDHADFALVGTGDASFVVDSGLTQTVLSYRNCRDCAFVGIDIDQSADNCSAQTAFNTQGVLIVSDVEFVGWSDPDDSGKKIAFNVRDASGVARFERVIANDGTEVGRSGVDHNDVHKQQYDGAYWSGPPHEGTAYLLDCEAAHWSDNALYASRTNGGIVVAGGYYANSSISQVRLGHPESFVGNGCHILIDRDQIPEENNPGGLAFTRGIWLESGHLNNPGATVGECYIEVDSVGSFGGSINVADSAQNARIVGPVEVIAPGSLDRLTTQTTVDVGDGAIQNVEVFSSDGDGDDTGGTVDDRDTDTLSDSNCT